MILLKLGNELVVAGLLPSSRRASASSSTSSSLWLVKLVKIKCDCCTKVLIPTWLGLELVPKGSCFAVAPMELTEEVGGR